jgi:hypothetical protein
MYAKYLNCGEVRFWNKNLMDGMKFWWAGLGMKQCDKILEKTLSLVEDMLSLADEGDEVREDVGCGVVYGVLRDSAFKIKRLAEAERDGHAKKGWWKD